MHVVVIGAGIAGLSAAYELRRRVPDARVTVLEGADRVGGKLRVSEVGGMPVDEGAEMFLVRVPEAVRLVAELGLAGSVVHPVTTAAGVYVDGAPAPLPAGTVMGVPARPEAVRGVLGEAGVRAAAAEPGLPGEPLTGDVAVGEYVARRLGRPFVDRLVDPLLGGVYAGRADLLSLRATVPALYAALRETPSLLEAAAKAAPQPPPSLTGGPGADAQALDSPRGNPVFGTLPDGLGSLPPAVLAASGADLRLRLPAREIRRTENGFRVVAGPVPDPTHLDADAVIVAVPANKAAPLLRLVAPNAAAELAAIEYASMAIVTLAYRGIQTPAASGLLVPATAGRTIKALTYSSTKWAHLNTAGSAVIRASIGRYGEAITLQRDDPDLVDAVRADLAALTGIAADPIATRVTRWGGGLPQYAVGHVDRVARIRHEVSAVPGLAVCGAAYEGVGVPACIRSALAAVAQVLDGDPHGAQSTV
jgi:protoporphyrinogen/coproporphyrinogen III oxidase